MVKPFSWGTGLGGEPLLEDLMRIAARQPGTTRTRSQTDRGYARDRRRKPHHAG